VQWYVHVHQWQQVLDWQQQYRLPCVLDHVGGMTVHDAQQASVWTDLQKLSDAGAWIKLSGWYRLGLAAPYALERLMLHRVVDMFAQRFVWGSDWPHTSFVAGQAPSYDALWQPLAAQITGCASHTQRQAQQLYAP
jgi:predicted TIM-barrel fold metal-dependent hydrolase